MITLIRRISSIAISLTLIFCSVVPAFAEPTEEQYEYINNKSEAIAAIQAYLNYRGLGVICDVRKAADEWLINQQIELQDLFSGVEKTAGGVLKFRYDYAVLQKLNSFVGDLVRKYNFAEFNDDNVEQTERVYSGQIFTDDDGNQCLVYYCTLGGINDYAGISQFGSSLKYSTKQLVNLHSISQSPIININGTPYTYNFSIVTGPGRNNPPSNSCLTINGNIIQNLTNADCITHGYITVAYYNNKFWLGVISLETYLPGNEYNSPVTEKNSKYKFNPYTQLSTADTSPSNIDIKTPKGIGSEPGENEPVIPKDSQGNTYNYNNYQTYIDNSVTNNTTYYPSSDEDPDTPTVPDFPGGTLTPGGNGGYDFDIDLPDFSGVNWSLNGNNISQKFPFSIPWDLMAFFSVLNAEPETPEIHGDIDLGIVVWEIDWDFHQFDSLATIVRNMEFIAFCIGLILATRSLIKG